MTGQDTPRIPDISVEDPNWGTFEDIEEYASREPTGVLQRLLPSTVWEYFFAPTDTDPAKLRRDRRIVVTEHQRIQAICEDILSETHTDSASPLEVSSSELHEAFPIATPAQYPLSLFNSTDHDERAEYLRAARSTITTERELITVTNHLLSQPAAVFLRRSEKQLLGIARTLFQHSVEHSQDIVDHLHWFDTQFDALHDQLIQLLDAASPFIESEQYLPDPTRKELTSRINELQAQIRRTTEEMDPGLLREADRNQLEDLRDQVNSVESQLEGYNTEFVAQQRARCKPLFTDIGPENLSLTAEQERAVIRNGIYNQVIAAAGTGKTLTLTTRVAYLISEQDVDPADILIVTYTNEATDEMRDRLQNQFGITDVTVQTIQSFGYGLIQETQDGFVESIDSNEQWNFVDQQIRDARNGEQSEFLNHYYEFLVHFDDVYHDETEFDTRKAYVEARLEQTYVTLKGTEVKSRAEKLIADFLFTHQVEYQYEARASWADSVADKAGYTPDFYLPNYDLYIEHWGIDESGLVAPWFSQNSEQYRDKMRWGRQQFTDTEHTLVGTYEFEHEANRLKEVLHHRLTHHGVELDRVDFEELVETAYEYEHREGWIKTRLASFVENAKRFKLRPDDIAAQLTEENPRQYHFGHCGIHLLQQYALYLTRNGLIDFQDMVHDAVDTIQRNPEAYNDRYEHLLVDEFQDIGKGKLELIQELTGENAARLFAVGDDWQSIYSFQGAVIDYFTDFAAYFGDPVRTELTENFRSPPTPIEAGNHLIENNTNQLDKTVRSTLDRDHTPRVHVLRGYQFYDYVRRIRSYTVTLAREYISAGADPADIMVLCRYDDAVPYLSEIKDGLQSQHIPYTGKSDQYRGPDGSADDGVSVYSLYQAKGREAKHVILVHAAEGPYGFPSDRRDGELLDPIKPIDVGGVEEERRAFYVAVTRTERTLDFLTRAEKQSQFLEEINEYTERIDAGQVEPLDDVGKRMSVIVEVDQVLDPWAKQHQRGILADQYGGSARFVSWANTDPPTLKENEWYRLNDLKVSEFNDEKELVWTADSTAHQLESEPSLTTTPYSDEQKLNSTTSKTNNSQTETTNSSVGTQADSTADAGALHRLSSGNTVTDHHDYQKVLSTLRRLGGEASTYEITIRIAANSDETHDRLQTLEAHGKVTQSTDDETQIWKLTE
ncbi:UvrD-helicase domain-containing protein [Halorubrum sp. RMP-47]|uniref:UvrD-helicase domain-containing protein n=1 Tax=Halorubrum miltondacostae TaxID=3076378 RepID=UPI0035285A78